MPRIQWHGLPAAIRQHLVQRAAERSISTVDLEALKAWVALDPLVPDGPWWKEFGSFKLVGEGKYPKTFLTREQSAFGLEVE